MATTTSDDVDIAETKKRILWDGDLLLKVRPTMSGEAKKRDTRTDGRTDLGRACLQIWAGYEFVPRFAHLRIKKNPPMTVNDYALYGESVGVGMLFAGKKYVRRGTPHA